MAPSDEIRMVLHEECQYKHSDVHSVVIGIGRHDDLVVSEIFDILLKSESVDQEVQLFVLRDLLAAFLVAVDRLTSQREYSLSLCITSLGDRSARRVSLGDEDAGKLSELLLGCRQLVLVVVLAVAELLVVYA